MFFIVFASCGRGPGGDFDGDYPAGDGDGDSDADGGGGDGDGDSDGDGDADGPLEVDGDTGGACGDGRCDPGETAASCPEDCGDGLCTGTETTASCGEDCPADCGDGLCSPTETVVSCGEDCLPAGCLIAGFMMGKHWEYRYRGDLAGTSSSEVTALAGTGDSVELTLVSESSYRTGDASITDTTTSQMSCDDEGVYTYTTESRGRMVTASADYPYDSTVRYSPPYVFRPGTLEVGSSWTSELRGTTTGSSGTTSFSTSYRYTVTRAGTRTVPAGTFSAVEISGVEIGGSGATLQPYWYVEGLGTIERTNMELTDYAPR